VQEDGGNHSQNDDFEKSFLKVVEYDDDQEIERKDRRSQSFASSAGADDDCNIYPGG
jgi:hypothetical protein